jgi:hypothetical protein
MAVPQHINPPDGTWKFIAGSESAKKIGSVVLPNHRCKVYRCESERPRIYMNGDDEYAGRAFIVMNTNKDETTFELIYDIYRTLIGKTPPNPSIEKYHIVGSDVIGRLFGLKFEKVKDDYVKQLKNVKFREIDGHFLFVYKTRYLLDHNIGRGEHSMPFIFPGELSNEQGWRICNALLYPTINSIKDADYIEYALNRCATHIRHVNTFYFENRRDYILGSINKVREQIDKVNSEIASMSEKCADALNKLSEKYGIEISV